MTRLTHLLGCLLVLTLCACGGGGGGSSSSSTTNDTTSGSNPNAAVSRYSCADSSNTGSVNISAGTKGSGWTYLIYLAANNNLSTSACYNIQQMLAANGDPSVRLIVMSKQNSYYSGGTDGKVHCYAISAHVKQALTCPTNNGDTQDKATLSSFISWGLANYGSTRNALVLWSHGDGWKNAVTKGAIADDSSSSSSDLMSISDIQSAISTGLSNAKSASGTAFSNAKLDLLNFDACLMAMYEVGYAMQDVANYLVASEDSIPGDGNPYTDVVNRMVSNPSQDAATLASGIVADYYNYYNQYSSYYQTPVTLSAVDLSKIGAVHTAVVNLAAELKAAGISSSNKGGLNTIASNLPYYTDANNVDLGALAQAIASSADTTLGSITTVRNAANAVTNAVNGAVIANKVLLYSDSSSNSKVSGSTGLAIWFPSNSSITQSELTSYAALSNNSGVTNSWYSFVYQWKGSSYANAVTGKFSYALTWDNPTVDLDLIIREPSRWAGPAYGTTSSNGNSSRDSYYSGLTSESYTAKNTVTAGNYEVFVVYNRYCQTPASTFSGSKCYYGTSSETHPATNVTLTFSSSDISAVSVTFSMSDSNVLRLNTNSSLLDSLCSASSNWLTPACVKTTSLDSFIATIKPTSLGATAPYGNWYYIGQERAQ